jgi:hypothetical protein
VEESLGEILGKLVWKLRELILGPHGLLAAGLVLAGWATYALGGLGALLLLAAWTAYWLWGVNWQRTWQFLAQGAWVPLVLLLVMAAIVWSQLAPGPCECLGTRLDNFWWQLGAVAALLCWTLFLGWVQGFFGWTPPEIDLEPPAHTEAGHGHGHH